MTVFNEDFESLEDIKKQYQITDADLDGVEVLYAGYQTGCYDGRSLVLFKKDDKLYVVDGAHCSCYGLEGQWDPTETTPAALKMEIDAKSNYRYEDFKSFIEFCNQYFGWNKV